MDDGSFVLPSGCGLFSELLFSSLTSERTLKNLTVYVTVECLTHL